MKTKILITLIGAILSMQALAIEGKSAKMSSLKCSDENVEASFEVSINNGEFTLKTNDRGARHIIQINPTTAKKMGGSAAISIQTSEFGFDLIDIKASVEKRIWHPESFQCKSKIVIHPGGECPGHNGKVIPGFWSTETQKEVVITVRSNRDGTFNMYHMNVLNFFDDSRAFDFLTNCSGTLN